MRNARSDAVRNVMNSRSVAGALHNPAALRHSNMRSQIVASAAIAGWHDGRGRGGGWWQHRDGGYGWVGPLFWPFAYNDVYDYAMWGYGDDPGFWNYGYNDIYAGLFSPYDYDSLTGYLPSSTPAPVANSAAPATPAAPDQLAQMCGQDDRDIAGLPIDQIQQAVQPNDAQKAALDDLANASTKAAQDIKAACPTQIGVTAPVRLASMQQRIEAMISAVGTVQSPLQQFYDSLSDDQKARLNALGQDQRQASSSPGNSTSTPPSINNGLSGQSCDTTQSGLTAWPTAEIETRLRPTDAQRADLAKLQDANAKAADMLKSSCQANDAITPPARLEAVGKRLDVMLQAVKTVRAPLDDLYATLNDEQKAQFEAIGPGKSGVQSKSSEAVVPHARRAHVNVGRLVRNLISIVR